MIYYIIGDSMKLVVGTMLIIIVSLIIISYFFVKSRKKRNIKYALSKLEIEKNKIDSSPIIPELAKVENFLNNEKLQKMYNEWKERLQQIREEEVPKLNDMIIEIEYSLQQKDYKSTIYKIAKLEMKMYKVRTKSEFLLGEIKEITNSEERSRVIITDLKVKFRELHQKFQDSKSEFGNLESVIQKQFETISKQFEEFENIMDNKDYAEVNGILKVIDDLLKHMNIVIEEVPSIVLLSTNVLPKKISEIEEIYNQMIKADYPLDYLNVEYNIEEANKKINDIMVRTQELNLQDSLFELKVLLDYFDSLFGDFDKEKNSRAVYAETNNNFKKRLHKINDVIDDIFLQLDDLKNVYNLTDDNISLLSDINDQIQKINDDYKILLEHVHQNNFAYSKLLSELELLIKRITTIEENLDTTLDTLGNMRDDEIRARQQLEEIKVILKDSKLKIREYNLPVIPQSYFVELNEASSAIREIVKELNKKPITISVLNTRVDTARDLAFKLYQKTNDLLQNAAMAEILLVYSNRYRSSIDGLSNKLNLSEQLFLKGEYKKSLDLVVNIMNKIEPNIYERLLKKYNEIKEQNNERRRIYG